MKAIQFDPMSTGEELRKRRRRLPTKVSQWEFADLAGVNRSTYNRLENGKLPNVTLNTMIVVVRTLKCQIEDVLVLLPVPDSPEEIEIAATDKLERAEKRIETGLNIRMQRV